MREPDTHQQKQDRRLIKVVRQVDGAQAVELKPAKRGPQQGRGDQREPDDESWLDDSFAQAVDRRPSLLAERVSLIRERRGLVSNAHNGEIADGQPAKRFRPAAT
jgi:hypothetical protein